MDPEACSSCGQTLAEGVCPHCATASGVGAGPQGHVRESAGAIGARPLDGSQTIDGYRLVRELGAGGMGTVYLADDVTLGRRVAIKVITARLSADETVRARFLREARAMATVEHPHLVRIYSFGTQGDFVYLVMEYVQGETLRDLLRRAGPLPIAETVRIAREVAEALEAAWERGIVHRDIKPANILMDARGGVHVADFGLAKSVEAAADEAGVTQDGHIVGTPQYLSPEQARGEPVDFRSDVYSLGILLYEMLTGATPFHGATPSAVVSHHLTTAPPPLREKRAGIPASLTRLVERMTEKDPAKRPAPYAELRRSLADVLEPVPAWTVGSPYRGLAAFEFEHAPVFFGRAQAVAGVLDALRAQAARGRAFVLVLGMSGSGKSSLVRAGVLPQLVQPETIPGVSLWRRVVVRPADAAGDVFDGLAAALLRPEALPELGADGTTARDLARLLRDSPAAAAPLIKGGLSQAAAEAARAQGRKEQPEVRLAIVVDQMEELFTLERITLHERRAFVEGLSALAASGRVWVLATLRSDFYARCEEIPALMTLKEGVGQYHLLPPTAAEVAQMIRQPARAAALKFEVDPATQAPLDETLRDAAVGQVGNLPLLEFALEELYRQRTADGLLTVEAYRTLGGVEGALARRAEEVFGSLSKEAQGAAADVFAVLARAVVGEDESFTRKYALLDSFTSPGSRTFIDAFVEARLCVADRGDDGRAVVSIAHEALLRSWPRLRSWLEDNRELLRVRSRAAMAATLWEEKGRPADLLLAEGKPLEEAVPLLAMKGFDLSGHEREFLEASQARAQRRSRARQIVNMSSMSLLVTCAALVSLTLWKAIPTFASVYESLGLKFPLPTRLVIMASNWTLWLSPLLITGALFLYFSKRVRFPDSVKSGTALAIVTSVAFLFCLVGLVALLVSSATVLADVFRWLTGTFTATRATLEMRNSDYAGAVQRLRLHRAGLVGRSVAERDTAPYTDLLLGDAYLTLGDDDAARGFYEDALRGATDPGPQNSALRISARKGLTAAEADPPRLGILCLDARGGAAVAGVNRGGPAFRAGLRKDDVIRKIDGVALADRAALVAELRRRGVGQVVQLEVARGEGMLAFAVPLGRASEIFAGGCDRGNAEDCASLGMVYARGEGVLVDHARARELYQRACDQGDWPGCVSLGLVFERDTSTTADPARAATLYRRACDAGDVWGCHNLGVLAATGKLAAKDVTQAGALLSRACAAGLPEGCANHLLWSSRTGSQAFLGLPTAPHTR